MIKKLVVSIATATIIGTGAGFYAMSMDVSANKAKIDYIRSDLSELKQGQKEIKDYLIRR